MAIHRAPARLLTMATETMGAITEVTMVVTTAEETTTAEAKEAREVTEAMVVARAAMDPSQGCLTAIQIQAATPRPSQVEEQYRDAR